MVNEWHCLSIIDIDGLLQRSWHCDLIPKILGAPDQIVPARRSDESDLCLYSMSRVIEAEPELHEQKWRQEEERKKEKPTQNEEESERASGTEPEPFAQPPGLVAYVDGFSEHNIPGWGVVNYDYDRLVHEDCGIVFGVSR
jgi:hypothetical protein